MMERHFDAELKKLKQELVSMAGYVERAIDIASDVLINRKRARLAEIFEVEKEINSRQVHLDSECVRLLALQQPLAADLRLIVAVLRINTDLERMGDQIVNIGETIDLLFKQEGFRTPQDVLMMLKEAKFMVRESLDAFVQENADLARDVLKRDDTVDGLKDKVLQDEATLMKADPTRIDEGLSVILIARNLERLADHATNVAEDVIFAVTAKDVRHGG